MLLKLLTAPISAPLAGFKFILGQIQDLAERELLDPTRIREELLLLQLRLEEGEIDEDEYAIQEADIMARLRAARAFAQGPVESRGAEIEWTGPPDAEDPER